MGDSQLVVDQMMKNASYNDEKMEAYCNAVRTLRDKFLWQPTQENIVLSPKPIHFGH
jgi:hypothetical protein